MNKKLSDVELSYIAGFFDGEGSITIHENCRPSPRGKTPNHTLQVSIGNTDPRVLVRLKACFGGGLSYRKSTNPKWRGIAQWCVRAKMALPFLLAIFPYLRMKQDAARIAIKYQRTKKMSGPFRVSDKDIAWRESCRKEIRRLNAREWV